MTSMILAMDAIALMDALGIERFAVPGHDWGSNMTEAQGRFPLERLVRRYSFAEVNQAIDDSAVKPILMMAR